MRARSAPVTEPPRMRRATRSDKVALVYGA